MDQNKVKTGDLKDKIECDELRMAINEYLTVAEELYAAAATEADRAAEFLRVAEKSLSRLNIIADQLGVKDDKGE